MINTFRTLFEARERKFQQERLFRGESVDLVAKITTDGVLDTLSGYSISGVYQPTDDLSGDIYSVDAEIVDGKAILHWTNDNDFGKDAYNVWGLLTKDGKAAYPICWRLMFAHSPSYPLGTPDPIPRTIDFSQYELLNAPWLPLSGGTLSGRIYYDIEEPAQITNLSSWIGDATGLGRGIITIYNETQNTLDDKYSQEGATLSGRWDNMWNPPNPTGPLVFPENPSEGDVFEPYAAMDGEYLNGKDVTFSKGTVLIANPGWETKEVPCFKIHVVYTYIYHNGEGWVPRSENDWCICKINGEWQAASFARGFTAYDSLVWHEFSEGGTEPREPDPFVLSSEIADLATKQYVQEAIASIPTPEVAGFATYEYVDGKFETKVHADETKIELDSKIATKVSKEELSAELSDYATESFVNDSFNNARTYTDEQIDWLSNVYMKSEDITATYETKQHAADTYHTKADAVADTTYLNGRIDGVIDSLSDYAQLSDIPEIPEDLVHEDELTAYAQLSDLENIDVPEISACLSSAEFSAITELANDGSASLSSIVDKLDEVIRALKRSTPTPPVPPPPVTTPETHVIYTNNTESTFNITGTLNSGSISLKSSAKEIRVGTNVTAIGDQAFKNCSNLSSLILPNTVTSMGNEACYGCTQLTALNIPSSLTSIHHFALRYVPKLASITVDANNPVFDSRDNCNAIIETSTNKMIHGCKNTVFPSTVTSTGEACFCDMLKPESGLEISSFTVPGTVTTLGNYTFSECNGLTALILEEGIQSTGTNVFEGMRGLTVGPTLPSTLTALKHRTFSYCENMQSLTIPSTITSIGSESFLNNTATITFADRTKAQVQAMSNFRWSASSGKIVCTDGTL